MTRSLPRRLLLFAALPLLLACPKSTENNPAPPVEKKPLVAQETQTDTTATTASPESTSSKELYVVVSISGGKFSVSPEPLYVQHRGQKVTWIAEDCDAAIEIEYKPKDQNPQNPEIDPPAKPCPGAARKCGGNEIGGKPGHFRYTVKGTQRGEKIPDFDPEVIILF